MKVYLRLNAMKIYQSQTNYTFGSLSPAIIRIHVLGDLDQIETTCNPPCNARDKGSVPGQGTKTPHAVQQLSPCTTATELRHSCPPQLESRHAGSVHFKWMNFIACEIYFNNNNNKLECFAPFLI